MPERRIPKTRARANYWTGLFTAPAATGGEGFTASSRWLHKEIVTLAEHNPEAAEAVRWHAGRQLLKYASRVPRMNVDLRRGLTPEELEQILNPWAKPQEGGGLSVVR